MAIASSGGAPPPTWLDTLGKVAGVILGLELVVVLLIICALMVGLALGMRWIHIRLLPVLREYTPKARQALEVTEQSTNRVVNGVAEFYARRQAVRTGIRVLLFGRQSARRVHDDSMIQAATDLDLMETDPNAAREHVGGNGHNGTGHAHAELPPAAGAAGSELTGERVAPAPPDSPTRPNHRGADADFARTAGNAG